MEAILDIVDTQAHLFLTMDDDSAVQVMDALGIASVLIDEAWDFGDHEVPHSANPAYPLPTGQYRPISPGGQKASMRRPDRFSYLLRINPEDPDMESWMRQVAATPGFRAFRHVSMGLAEEEAGARGDRMAFFKAAEKIGLPVFIGTPGRVADFEQYIKACPALPVVFDHCGIVKSEDHFQDLLRLAHYETVHVKWSHGPLVFDAKTYPYPEVRPWLLRALEAYGRERIMWASDFSAVPFVRMALGTGPLSTWSETLYHMRDNPDLSESDKQWVLGRTARALLKWDAPAA